VAIHAYRLLPEDRRDQEAQEQLVRRVDEIVDAEVTERVSRQRDISE
jgi:hypothetical protein